MPVISTVTARAEFTNALVVVYKEYVAPTAFLRSFFRNVEKSTLSLSIAVQRGIEKIAVDVERGSNGNANKFAKSTEKDFIPPYYYEWFNINEMDVYRTLFTSTDIEISVFADFLADVVEKMKLLQATVERAYEKQCADVLTFGIVSLNTGTSIDFKRKAASLVDLGAGNYFATGAVDPTIALKNAGKFLREKGKAQGGTYNVIMGDTALSDFLNNATFQAKYDLRNVTQGEIREPQRNALGGTLHGRVTGGSYTFNIWTYPEGYEDTAGTFQYYIDPKKVIVIPENPNFVLGFAAVPQLPSATGTVRVGAYIFTDRIDANQKNHIMELESAGVAIPVAIDQIYTFKAVA